MTTFSIGIGDGPARLHDAAALLAEMEARGLASMGGHLTITVNAVSAASELLRKVSTCEAGCGCTVYSPKADCPEPSCPCLTATPGA